MPLYGRRAILSESGRGVAVSSLTRVIADRPKHTNHSRSAWIQGGAEMPHMGYIRLRFLPVLGAVTVPSQAAYTAYMDLT
jgi:hypothetical protein